MTSTSSGSGANSTAAQSGGDPSGSPTPPQPMPGLWTSGRQPGRIGLAQALEGDLGVRVGAVLGEDRQDQLAGRVEAALPGLAPVDAGKAVEDVSDETRAGSARVASRRSGRGRRTCASSGAASTSASVVAWVRAGHRSAVLRAEAQQRGEALAAALQRGGPGGHRRLDGLWSFGDGHRDGADRGEGIDPLGFDAATDGDARDTRDVRLPGDPERRLAEGGLGVDPALARDDEIRVRELVVEAGRLHDQLDAGAQRERSEPILDRQERITESAGGTGPGRVALVAARPGSSSSAQRASRSSSSRPRPVSRPSAVRTSPPRPPDRGAGS